MTDKQRNWQEDMNGCAGLPPTPWAWVSTEEAEWIEDSNQEIVIGSEEEYIFDDLLGPNVRKEAFMRFVINAPEALPYWLQQYDVELRGRKRWAEVARGLGDDLKQAESLIQRKDTEIAALKRLAEFWGSQYNDAIKHGNETEERLNVKIAGLTALLQGKGDTP
jgi:hypothetical protein